MYFYQYPVPPAPSVFKLLTPLRLGVEVIAGELVLASARLQKMNKLLKYEAENPFLSHVFRLLADRHVLAGDFLLGVL